MKKTAVVTGGSRGIGFAIARQLGLDGETDERFWGGMDWGDS